MRAGFSLVLLASCFAFLPPTAAYALKTLVIINNGNSDVVTPFHLVSSEPADRQMLEATPALIKFTFSQSVMPDKSTLRLYNLNGDKLDVGDLVAKDKSMSITVPELSSGKYTIKWRAYCQCTDNTELSDSFHFTVR